MKEAFYFSFKILMNVVFSNYALLNSDKRTLVKMVLAFFIAVVNLPATFYAFRLEICKAEETIYTSIMVLTISLEMLLHVFFYASVRSPLVYPHTVLSVFLDFLLVIGIRKSVQNCEPKFDLGRCKVPIVVNSRVALQRMETVHVIRTRDGKLLVKKLNGEEHYVDASLIEEETENII